LPTVDQDRTAPPGLYFSHPACLEHDPAPIAPGHPDTPQRLVALERELEQKAWLGWERREAPQATMAQLELAHSQRHIHSIERLCAAGGGMIDPDTYTVQASFRAARHAAGAAVEMTRALLAAEAKVGFCAIRPSGHHAERDRAMGFCLFNNIAVAAASAIAEHGLERVFVLDWDVHHGNGTAEIFHARDDVLLASIHQSPLYPGTGPLTDDGSGQGKGYTINLPVPPGAGEELWLALMDQVILPRARAFKPELILVSSGVDAHQKDPLASCNLTTTSFKQLAARTRDLARDLKVPLGVVQEGGYNPEVLAECVAELLPTLAGDEPPSQPVEETQEHGDLVKRAKQQYEI
jgi:acetoin utilization deacetylase AcuC-like enzyme